MLRPDTQALWDIVKEHPALGGFVLIGGTALTMHLNHRISEDLDFAFSQSKLPRAQIHAFARMLDGHGWRLVANDSQEALQEFEDSGMDLHDYQQDFIAHGPKSGAVKVTLLAPDQELACQMKEATKSRPRVASIDEIFNLKCIACANRSKRRDWLDLFLLLNREDFQPMDLRKPFETAQAPQKFDIAMRRLCSGRVDSGDEGYLSLLENPPSIIQMQEYFVRIRDQIEVDLAARAKASRQRV